jgi:acetoin utilization deacetylase AcuC-like enzyme
MDDVMSKRTDERKTAFFWDERCFWHFGGQYAFILPVGDLVQPMVAGGLPETPDSKRRLKNLLEVTGLLAELDALHAPHATEEELQRVHAAAYLDEFKRLSDANGGEIGERTPFGKGGYDIARLSAGLGAAAVRSVLDGRHRNAYALCRPPGHHCLPAKPMGYCLLANASIAAEIALKEKGAGRVAIVDWDVHHGNGTEAIFYDRNDVLTISLHQENCYPRDSGAVTSIGEGRGEGANINVPLFPGSGHDAYLYAVDRIVLPALRRFKPDVIIVACGFDASGVDPLSRMLATSQTFAQMTRRMIDIAEDLCGGRLAFLHEGGYSEVHVPFCGHAVIAELADSRIVAPDPLATRLDFQQPSERFRTFQRRAIDEMADFFKLG